jgi:hypothetical protein
MDVAYSSDRNALQEALGASPTLLQKSGNMSRKEMGVKVWTVLVNID